MGGPRSVARPMGPAQWAGPAEGRQLARLADADGECADGAVAQVAEELCHRERHDAALRLLPPVRVDGHAHASLSVVEGGREQWDQNNDFNRLKFRREGGEWMIESGL